MSVRPLRIGGGGKLPVMNNLMWAVSLRATYTIRKDLPARLAYQHFLSLLWFRIRCSQNGKLPNLASKNNVTQQPIPNPPGGLGTFGKIQGGVGGGALAGAAVGTWFFPGVGTIRGGVIGGIAGGKLAANSIRDDYKAQVAQIQGANQQNVANAKIVMLMEFGFDEGLYLDSKSITFNASWFLSTTWSNLLHATGVWRWWPNSSGGNAWALSVKDVMGWKSWLTNRVDQDMDIIVDLGGGEPLPGPPVGGVFPG
jgi:hypothetical protein